MVVENQSTTNYLNFDVDVQLAQHVRHSRHAKLPYNSHDCIPPRHRQVVFVTEWVDRNGEPSRLNLSYSYSHDKRATDARPPIDTFQHDFHSPRAF